MYFYYLKNIPPIQPLIVTLNETNFLSYHSMSIVIRRIDQFTFQIMFRAANPPFQHKYGVTISPHEIDQQNLEIHNL